MVLMVQPVRVGEGGVLHADAGSLHTRSPERVRTVDVAP